MFLVQLIGKASTEQLSEYNWKHWCRMGVSGIRLLKEYGFWIHITN